MRAESLINLAMTRPAASAASAASGAVEWGEELLATPERQPKIGGSCGKARRISIGFMGNL